MSMNLYYRPIDLNKVETLIYHMPDGPTLAVQAEGIRDLFDINIEIGDVCDTSEIDGVVHFFPRGHA